MAAENKMYDQMHGDDDQQQQQQLPPPQYPATPALQQAAYPLPSQGYGPPYQTTTPIMASAPGAGYPGVGGYGAVASASQPPLVVHQVVETFTGALIYACCVFWVCNCFFGFVGFILAVIAKDTVVSDPQRARKLARASYIVSSVGIVVTIVLLAILIGVIYGGACAGGYKYDGVCYRHRSSLYSHSECEIIGGVYHNGYCYYD